MFKIINYNKIKDLKGLQEIITLYNACHPEQKVSIVPEKRDVSQLFVCSYDEGKVGLFKTINWTKNRANMIVSDNQTGTIFLGIDSTHIGLKTKWKGMEIWHASNYTQITRDGVYISTCHMHHAVVFEELRFTMHQEGLIQNYELGFADSKEILQVLDYATEYFKKEQLQETKKK